LFSLLNYENGNMFMGEFDDSGNGEKDEVSVRKSYKTV